MKVYSSDPVQYEFFINRLDEVIAEVVNYSIQAALDAWNYKAVREHVSKELLLNLHSSMGLFRLNTITLDEHGYQSGNACLVQIHQNKDSPNMKIYALERMLIDPKGLYSIGEMLR